MAKRTAILTIIGAGLAALPAVAIAEPYQLVAFEAPGMLPFPGDVIIRDARTRIPPIVRGCGVPSVETIGRTDGVVEFRFDASDQQIPCLERKLPNGTQLHPTSRKLK